MQTQETGHFSQREEESDGKARIPSLKAEHMELEQSKYK